MIPWVRRRPALEPQRAGFATATVLTLGVLAPYWMGRYYGFIVPAQP